MNYLLSFVTLAALTYAIRTRRDRNDWRTKYWLSLNDVERAEKERDDARMSAEMANCHLDVMLRVWESENDKSWLETN